MKNKITSSNQLQALHAGLLCTARSFREKICRECGWSEATFYRKAKGPNAISRAEWDKMIEVFMNCFSEAVMETNIPIELSWQRKDKSVTANG